MVNKIDLEIEKQKRKLKRLIEKRDEMRTLHDGKEDTVFNYWGGRELGYLEGKVSILEDLIDILEGLE